MGQPEVASSPGLRRIFSDATVDITRGLTAWLKKELPQPCFLPLLFSSLPSLNWASDKIRVSPDTTDMYW
jgi:hypothetical protein